ncbi:MAG: RDD family protein [Bryobacteraceae bacterium]
MHCRYCSARNSEDDHRCGRCGRRLKLDAAKPAPETYPVSQTHGALAAAVNPVAPAPAAKPLAPQIPSQPSLFDHRTKQKVVPIRSASDVAPETSRRPRRPSPAVSEQPLLDFLPPAPHAPRTLKTSVEAVIFCDAPVATPMHRAIAAAIDASMILIGITLFLLVFQLGGGDLIFTKATVPAYAAAVATVGVFYGLLWALARGGTAGMRWTQLQVVNFDGHPPDARQRAIRFAGTILSILSAGLGLAWALVDEEGLTWHDHMSGTFPTLRDTHASSFRRR